MNKILTISKRNEYFIIRNNIKLFTKTSIPFAPLPSYRNNLFTSNPAWVNRIFYFMQEMPFIKLDRLIQSKKI
jgi:hypothetical protein